MAQFDTYRFIEKVRQFPVVYDPNHKNFRRTRIRKAVFEEIAKSLKVDVSPQKLKAKWRNLRDCYVKYLKRDRKKNYYSWPWNKEMRFLKPYIPKALLNQTESLDDNDLSIDDEPINVKTEADDSIEVEIDPTENSSKEDPLNEDTYNFEDQQLDRDLFGKSLLDIDSTDLIFLGYSKAVKRLSPKIQAVTKFKIAKVLMDAELEALIEDE